jgi:hypothetical protein
MEDVAVLQPSPHVMRRANNQIHRKWGLDGAANFECLIVDIPTAHYNENIDVAIGSRCAADL